MKKALVIALVVLAGALGFKAGQSDVINNQIITNDLGQSGMYQSEYKGKQYTYWYETESQEVMNEINNQINTACGSDPYCRQAYIDC